MKNYELSERADHDVENIAFYGMQQFGVTQAKIYHDGLIGQFEKIAKTPLHYPIVEGLDLNYRRCVYQKHSIYFINEGNRVLIVRVLGSQDISTSLGH